MGNADIWHPRWLFKNQSCKYMGEFRFRVPGFWNREPARIRTTHVVGLDGIPKPCKVRFEDDLLIITRNQSDSGRIYIGYPFAKHGELTICTGTLPESDQTYDLVRELARGTLNRLRNQTSIWQEGGLEVSEQVLTLIGQAIDCLSRSIISTDSENEQAASRALEISMDGIFALCEQFGQEISNFRVTESGFPEFWFAASVANVVTTEFRPESLVDLLETESTMDIVALDNRRILGPLFDASPMSNFAAGGADFNSRRAVLLNHCRQMMNLLPSNTTLIHAACGMSGLDHQHGSRRQQFQLATDILNLLDETGSRVPVLVSFDYPWAEKLAWSVGAAHPLQIAEDLMRVGSQISYLGLDINLDYWPNGSVARDPLQWIDAIDIWCQLGLPLVLCLRVPQYQSTVVMGNSPIEFDGHPSENVTINLATDSAAGPDSRMEVIGNSVRKNLSDDQRLQLLQAILPMAVARPGIHGIIWRQWSDLDDHRFPKAGLVDEFGEPKPIARVVSDFRKNTLLK